MIAASTMPANMVSLPSGTQLPTGSSGLSGAAGSGQTLTENNFFQLLTTQLENQDPLNPMTSDQFAAELAQFSTANGIQNLQASSIDQQAVGLVGHGVAVSGHALLLGQNGTATGALKLAAPASDVKVAITDASGNIVQTLDLGPMASGTQTFSWNGTSADGAHLAAGAYGFSLTAAGVNGAAVAASPYAVVPVTAVVLGGKNGPMLELGGGAPPMALSSVQQIF